VNSSHHVFFAKNIFIKLGQGDKVYLSDINLAERGAFKPYVTQGKEL